MKLKTLRRSHNPAKKWDAIFEMPNGKTKTVPFGARGMSDYTKLPYVRAVLGVQLATSEKVRGALSGDCSDCHYIYLGHCDPCRRCDDGRNWSHNWWKHH